MADDHTLSDIPEEESQIQPKKSPRKKKQEPKTQGEESGQPKKQRKPRKSKKETDPSNQEQQCAIKVKEEQKEEQKATKKRKEKAEAKQNSKQKQMSLHQVIGNKDSVKVQKEEIKQAEQKQVEQNQDVMMEEIKETPLIQSTEQLKKPKKDKKASPKKEKDQVVIHEKVLEWKQKKDQFATILKDLLNKGLEGREKQENSALMEGKHLLQQNIITDDVIENVVNELIRIKQASNSQSQRVELSESFKLDILKVIGIIIDSSNLNLESLTQQCMSTLKSIISDQELQQELHKLSLSELICANAERKSYGVRNKESILYEDLQDDALWCWELANTSLLPQEKQKNVQNYRNQRLAQQQKIKSLEKLIQSIEKSTQEKDIAKIQEAFEAYNKVLRKENALKQQQLLKEQQIREKEQKEKERQEQKEREKEMKEQERIMKEQERIKALKDKEEQKERERIEREEKAKAKEQERLDKKRKLDEEQIAKQQNPHQAKIQKVNNQQQITLAFAKKATDEQKSSILNNEIVQKSLRENDQNSQHFNNQLWRNPFIQKIPIINTLSFEKQKEYLQTKLQQNKIGLYVTKQALQQEMLKYKKLFEHIQSHKQRCKYISIEDSFMKYTGVFEKKSYILDPRNPLIKDETIIDYEMDSEEEWNEQNGEDVDKNNQEEDAEDDEIEKQLEQESQEEGFIVPDDYFSASEFLLSQNDGSQVQLELEERKQQYANRYKNSNVPLSLNHYIFQYDSNERGIINYLKEYKAVAFPKARQFPIKMKNYEEIETANDEKINSANKQNPNAINFYLVELVKIMHGSFESKQKIIDDFNQKHPDCSKKSIERKMRDLFEKDKKEQDPRQRWYATESTLVEFNLQEDEQLKILFNERLAFVLDEINKQKEEQIKIKEEKKVLLQQQKQEQQMQQQQQNTTPHKQQPLQFKEITLSQAENKVKMIKSLINNRDELQMMNNNQSENSENIEDKQSCEKTVKEEEKQKKVIPSKSLNSFFKPLAPEEKLKILHNELEKVKIEIQSKNQNLEKSKQLTINQATAMNPGISQQTQNTLSVNLNDKIVHNQLTITNSSKKEHKVAKAKKESVQKVDKPNSIKKSKHSKEKQTDDQKAQTKKTKSPSKSKNPEKIQKPRKNKEKTKQEPQEENKEMQDNQNGLQVQSIEAQ